MRMKLSRPLILKLLLLFRPLHTAYLFCLTEVGGGEECWSTPEVDVRGWKQ